MSWANLVSAQFAPADGFSMHQMGDICWIEMPQKTVWEHLLSLQLLWNTLLLWIWNVVLNIQNIRKHTNCIYPIRLKYTACSTTLLWWRSFRSRFQLSFCEYLTYTYHCSSRLNVAFSRVCSLPIANSKMNVLVVVEAALFYDENWIPEQNMLTWASSIRSLSQSFIISSMFFSQSDSHSDGWRPSSWRTLWERSMGWDVSSFLRHSRLARGSSATPEMDTEKSGSTSAKNSKAMRFLRRR